MASHRAPAPSPLALPAVATRGLALLVLTLGVLVAWRAWASATGEVTELVAVPTTSEAVPDGRPAEPAPDTTTPAPLVVHVTGAVATPGVYELSAGSRIDDAIAAAAGLRLDADESALNRAQVLADGQQVYVPALGEAARPGDGGPAPGPPLVNLNTATAGELETLPGIGPSLAGRIVQWRADRGPFSSLEDLDAVPGIGPAILDQVRSLVTV